MSKWVALWNPFSLTRQITLHFVPAFYFSTTPLSPVTLLSIGVCNFDVGTRVATTTPAATRALAAELVRHE